MEIADHIRRIFDLVLSSPLFDNFISIIDTVDDLKVAPIKLDVLRCIALLSLGLKLFSLSEITIAIDQDQ